MADAPADLVVNQESPKTDDIHDIEFTETYDLSYIDVIPGSKPRSEILKNLHITVVGGGPAGLIFASHASKQGAQVTLFEKASDPRGDNPGYTDRSFNITLENVGRLVLGTQISLKGGVRVVGRALYPTNHTDKTILTKYGAKQDDDIISIPRPVLRQKMVDDAVQAGVAIHFDSKVNDINPDEGTLQYKDKEGKEVSVQSDLIIVADGMHSMGDKFVLKLPEASIFFNPDRFSCVTTNVFPSSNDVSMHHINFWHEPGNTSFTIGVPNADGSIALLICSTYENVENSDFPFADEAESKKLLENSFPNLYAKFPELTEVLPIRRKYKFFYKAVSDCVIGEKAVLMGDSACVMPVWAAFGANSAMYTAASLVYWLVHFGADIPKALETYKKQQQFLSKLILDYVRDQGEFLSGPVMEKPDERSETSLAPLIRSARTQAGTM